MSGKVRYNLRAEATYREPGAPTQTITFRLPNYSTAEAWRYCARYNAHRGAELVGLCVYDDDTGKRLWHAKARGQPRAGVPAVVSTQQDPPASVWQDSNNFEAVTELVPAVQTLAEGGTFHA